MARISASTSSAVGSSTLPAAPSPRGNRMAFPGLSAPGGFAPLLLGGDRLPCTGDGCLPLARACRSSLKPEGASPARVLRPHHALGPPRGGAALHCPSPLPARKALG